MMLSKKLVQSGCAHVRVDWGQENNPDGSVSGYWACADCGTEFAPSAQLTDCRERLAAARETFDEAHTAIEAIAMNECDYCTNGEGFYRRDDGKWMHEFVDLDGAMVEYLCDAQNALTAMLILRPVPPAGEQEE